MTAGSIMLVHMMGGSWLVHKKFILIIWYYFTFQSHGDLPGVVSEWKMSLYSGLQMLQEKKILAVFLMTYEMKQ